MVATFRIDKIAELCRQLAFTPQDARVNQLAAAEDLLLSLDPAKAYPVDFIVFRITGYHPRRVDSSLLTGLALQHDLGLLIEQASDTLDLHVDRIREPVLDIEQVTSRFNVTSKTIQRWRRRGLAARRFFFADGKRRVGFLLSTVERFFCAHRDQVLHQANFSEIERKEEIEILRRARRLVETGCWAEEIFRRLACRLGRAPLTIAGVIQSHDRVHPEDGILLRAAEAPGEDQRAQIARSHRRGASVCELADQFGLPRWAIYRIILDDRVARLVRRKMKFIDDPLYHQPDADEVVEQIVSQQQLPAPAEPPRIPRDLPAYLQDLYRTPLLTPGRERALFLKFNFQKFQFATKRRRLEPQFARMRDVRSLEEIRRRIVDARNQIIRANLRLVVSVARRHLRPNLALMELISDGNLTLIRAADSYDTHKGHRFSTYATLALMKGFARGVPAMQSAARRAAGNQALLDAVPERDSERLRDLLHRDEVNRLLSNLDDREREILLSHYGLRNQVPATYEQVGSRLGLSKQRVRQIEQAALAKLRSAGA